MGFLRERVAVPHAGYTIGARFAGCSGTVAGPMEEVLCGFVAWVLVWVCGGYRRWISRWERLGGGYCEVWFGTPWLAGKGWEFW